MNALHFFTREGGNAFERVFAAKPTVGDGTHLMIGKQVDAVEFIPEGLDECRCRVDIFFRIVAGWNDRVTKDQVFFVADHAYIFLYLPVGDAGEFFVGGVVHVFHVAAHMIEIGEQLTDIFHRSAAAGFDIGVDSGTVTFLQESLGELELEEHFTAADGEAAGHPGPEWAGTIDDVEHLVQRHAGAGCPHGVVEADLQAFAAKSAPLAVNDDAARNVPQGLFRTGNDTAATQDAECFDMEQLRFLALGLGSGTPLAAQRTTVQEYDGPQTRAIVLGASVYLEDHPFHT